MGKSRMVLLVVILSAFTALALPATDTGAQQAAVGDGVNLAGTTWYAPWQAKHRGEAKLTVRQHAGGKVAGEFYIISFTRRDEGTHPYEETFLLEGTFKAGRLYMTGRTTLEGRTHDGYRILDATFDGTGTPHALVGQFRGTGWVPMRLQQVE